MRLPPPDVVATWPAPNYINPETRGPALIIVELIMLPLATICLALRLYVRFKLLNTSHWDDWMMVGAAVRSSFPTYRMHDGHTADDCIPVNSDRRRGSHYMRCAGLYTLRMGASHLGPDV